MKNIAKKWSFVGALALMMLVSFTTINVSDDWDVPDDYAKMENPMEADDESLEIGAALYKLHCKSCHGKYGEGDGTKADDLDAFPGDFTLDEFKDQSDGSMFYKTKIGRDEMPEFSKKIDDDEDIWHLVNFMKEM